MISMKSFPRRPFLYRTALSAVILLGALGITQFAWSQYARKSKVSKGPRAVGLIQLQSNGKARLIPVAIMIDGKFYDAGSYKADPVPMALDFETVYEGFRTGVSQGLMTITQPGHLKNTWIAEGTWLPAGAKPASSRKKAEVPNIEEKDEPPKLHRKSDKPAEASSPDKTASTSPADKAATSDQKPASPAPTDSAKADQKKSTTTAASASKSDNGAESVDLSRSIDDPNRPVLRRGKPNPNVRRERMKDFDEAASSEPAKAASPNQPQGNTLAKLIPAISDAGGPDAHSYSYDTKPAEEAAFREKMLALASAELRRANPAYGETAPSAKTAQRKSTSATHAARKPTTSANIPLSDVQLSIFDLSSSNEPILVLSAKASAPPTPHSALAGSQSGAPATGGVTPLPQEITLVAKTNLEGELRKMFFSATDAQHLDVAPRMELIDAVDADGDGRGELLFRRTSDIGSSYAIYRAAADQLWPLYEGTP